MSGRQFCPERHAELSAIVVKMLTPPRNFRVLHFGYVPEPGLAKWTD